MIIPLQDHFVFQIYECPICKELWLKKGAVIQCGVVHAPGDCCHAGDRMISVETACKVSQVLGEPLGLHGYPRSEDST